MSPRKGAKHPKGKRETWVVEACRDDAREDWERVAAYDDWQTAIAVADALRNLVHIGLASNGLQIRVQTVRDARDYGG